MKRMQVVISSFSEQVWPLLKGQTPPREQGGAGCGRVIQQVPAISLKPPCWNAQETHPLRQVSEEREHIPNCPYYFSLKTNFLSSPLGEKFHILIHINQKISYELDHCNMVSFPFIMRRTDSEHGPTLFLLLIRCWGAAGWGAPVSSTVWGPQQVVEMFVEKGRRTENWKNLFLNSLTLSLISI